MPYIKRIEIDGFKTFGLKTALIFEKGFTVITGPNGSGKTNIIDAVLFCLGELSAKRLRAENFSYLIFNGGSDSNIRKSRAKVVIQFDNSDGRIPIEATTVTISREISRDGESIYRINGRRVSRNHLLEVLSVAGINPNGHNIVPQGTLTRIAEISPSERRRIIEDMLGIAQYDNEKAEAEAKLKEADIAIKTALGQIKEVQKRLEDLERERNNLLRYNYLKREINYLESLKISWEINQLENEMNETASEIAGLEEKIRAISENREKLRLKRYEIESELRKIGFEEFEKKQARVLEIQVSIENLNSKLNEIITKISIENREVERLKRLEESLRQRRELIIEEIKKAESEINQLEIEQSKISMEISEKQSLYDSISSDISKIRAVFEDKAKKINALENELNKINEEKISIESEIAKTQSKISVFTQRFEDLRVKTEDLKISYNKLQESLAKLQEIMKSQTERLELLKKTLEKRVKRKNLIEKEIKGAETIAKRAREVLVRLEDRKKMLDKIRPEENALKNIENLAAMGVISGVYGRLKNLVKIDEGYERAIEAAASGWLDALVVEDLNVAFICVETLKKMRLGRIKIIPLNSLSPINNLNVPKINGILGRASSFIKCEKYYERAVEFVFGDTLLAIGNDEALTALKNGFRVVTVDGDLYETGGGVESGCYRSSINLSSFIPDEKVLKTLKQAVNVLENHLERRETIISGIENDIAEMQEEIMKISEFLGKIEGEVERVKKNINQVESNIKHVEKSMVNLSSRIKEENEQLHALEKKLEDLTEIEKLKKDELTRLKDEINLLKTHEAETRRELLANELTVLKQKYNYLESKISTLRSKIENVLKINLENLESEIEEISRQYSALEENAGRLLAEKQEIKKKIEDMEKSKEDLSKLLLSDKMEVEKFTSQMNTLDKELINSEKIYEENMKMLNDLKLKMQALKIRLSQHKEHLKMLGYEKPLEVAQSMLEDINLRLEAMRTELANTGPINQLADAQYLEQVSRYKEISIRLNELEKEKMAILKFIEEIEQKKYNVFMDAFNKINERLNFFFSKLTGGGKAFLKLESPENPFAGGVDIIVQFPNKTPILVSGASSGERSVSAVAFLFALQEFSPASFYLFDEMDAHLDVFHVERLGELLAEESSNSQLQFIVITLKPEMISKADKIYGVYEQNGISHVISTTFKDVQ